MTTINEAKAISRQLHSIHRNKYITSQKEEYYEFCAEQKACGYEVVSFEEYIGERNLKDEFVEFYANLSSQELQEY
jgi:hypothetical protein